MTPTLTVAWPLRRSGNQTLPGPPQFASAVVRSFAPAEAPLLQTYWLESTLTPAVPEGAPVLPPGGVIPPGQPIRNIRVPTRSAPSGLYSHSFFLTFFPFKRPQARTCVSGAKVCEGSTRPVILNCVEMSRLDKRYGK